MKVLLAALLAGSLSQAAQSQEPSCHHPEVSTKKLSLWMSKAESRAEIAEVVCYLHYQSKHYQVLAEEENAALQYAYEHPIGNSKYPSAAAHARTFKARYEESATRYANLAKQLEARERRDAPTS